MTRPRWARSIAAAAVLAPLLLVATRGAAAEGLAFMPKGGRDLLLQLAAGDAARLRELASAQRTEAQWRASFAGAKPMSEREAATLAAYLEIHMPLPAAALQSADVASALPPDGRMLAENECQSCHSLFAGYLTQSRDAQGWRNVFLSPFHRQMKLDAREREEFARYSALNMPMKVDDIPADMRF